MLNAEVPLGTFPLKKSVGAIADRSGAIRHHLYMDEKSRGGSGIRVAAEGGRSRFLRLFLFHQGFGE